MLTFQPIDEYLDLEGITLPIRGKNYLIPAPDARTGLLANRLMTLMVDASNGLDIEGDERIQQILADDQIGGGDLQTRILGPALQQMLDDGVPWPMVQLAFQTTMVWISQGAPTAARYWATGGGELGKAPSRKIRRATRKARQGSGGSKHRTH